HRNLVQICHLMFVKMSGALLPSFSLFCPAIAQPLAEMLMQLVPIDVISQGDRRPLLHHCPGIAIRLTPSKPRKRSPGGDDCSRDRPVRSSEVATTSRMKRTSATFDERSWAPSAAPMSMGPKADSADLQPVASAKSPIRPDHSHWLPGAYSQKLGGKFAQRFCDATVKISKRGSSILSVIPTVPFYEDMFDGIGQYAENQTLSEPERLTLEILDRLAKSPTPIQSIYNLGADRRLVDRMVDVGAQGGYVIQKRARGRDMLISPVYFSENPDAFADLAAGAGSTRVGRVVSLLSRHQGWPLALIKKTRRIGETQLTDDDINIILTLAGDGFAPPPVIETSHAGSNHFLFSPKPGLPRLGPAKRQIYETAMALVLQRWVRTPIARKWLVSQGF